MTFKPFNWIDSGGFLLAFIAGFINVIGFLGFTHEAVSHLTGVSSVLGLELSTLHWTRVAHLGGIIGSFVIGAGISGAVIKSTQLSVGRHYGVALGIEGLLLSVAMITLNMGWVLGQFLATMACGLQNAMATTYSGATIRTTHLTGIFTDIGIMIGRRCRGEDVRLDRLYMYALLVSGFILGGVAGSLGYQSMGFSALMIPASMTFILAFGYRLFIK